MKTHFDIEKLVKYGRIENELDYERALIADRKLRILAKENTHFKELRKRLRDLIGQYEEQNWSSENDVSSEKIKESDLAELVAENERILSGKEKR